MRESPRVRRPESLAVVAHDHDTRARRDDRDVRAQTDALLEQAALAGAVPVYCSRQQRKPTFGKKNVSSASVKLRLQVRPSSSLFDAPPRSGFWPAARCSAHSLTLPLMSNASFAFGPLAKHCARVPVARMSSWSPARALVSRSSPLHVVSCGVLRFAWYAHVRSSNGG